MYQCMHLMYQCMHLLLDGSLVPSMVAGSNGVVKQRGARPLAQALDVCHLLCLHSTPIAKVLSVVLVQVV